MHELIILGIAAIGLGLIAKVYPRIMIQIFDRYPEHFSPRHKSDSGDEIPTNT